MQNKLLTIIVPTYNMEAYLGKCLSSLIVNDGYMDLLEVLIINDGSKDKSSMTAHKYEKSYPQTFRVIDKENGNYGSCINRGLREATGKYIKILDADDFYDESSLVVLLESMRNIDVDLFLTDFTITYLNGEAPSYRKLNIPQRTVCPFSEIYEQLVGVQMHAIAYRTQMLLDMKYLQSEGISYTDTEWALLPMTHVEKIYYIDQSVYQYVVGREGQTMEQSTYFNRRSQIFYINSRLLQYYKETSNYSKDKQAFFYSYFKIFYHKWYFWSLIEDKFPPSELIKLDEELKMFLPSLWEELNEIKFGSMCFIRLWRYSGYNKSKKIKLYILIKTLRARLSKVYRMVVKK